jgi:hypothetical protein
MDENLLAGVMLILSALPALGLGLAILVGKWRPASLDSARDPERARVGTGRFLVLMGILLDSLGVSLLVAPEAQLRMVAIRGCAIVVVVSIFATISLLRAVRS